ncbi:MAG: hypothetical protein AAF216_01045 [Pseudomonadota bacterium]
MIRFIWLVVLAVMAGFSMAQAQTREVYTVSNIEVDQTADSVIEAQQRAFNQARRIGVESLIAKITLPEDLASAGGVLITPELAQRLAAAVDVQEETRGGGRYVGVLSVVMNPQTVRAFLDQQQIPYLDRQAPLAMVVPVGNGRDDFAWAAAWPDSDRGALAPFVTRADLQMGPLTEWIDLQADAAMVNAQRAVVAELRGSAGGYVVSVSVLTSTGQISLGTTRTATDVTDAALATSELLSQTWKRNSIIRSGTRTIITANVLYTSLAEWNTLRGALSRSPLVSEFQTQAVARDGAQVRFAYAGEEDRLSLDLRQRGVALDVGTYGFVLRSAVSSLP